jgi:Flp pilus assembly protein TadB
MTKVGSLRASDADREQVVTQLHKASTEGRIAAEELEDRVQAALKARTYSELDATVADLPRQLNQQRPGHSPARRNGRRAVSAVRAHPALLLFAIPVLAVTFAMVIAATVLWAVMMVIVMVVGGRRPPAPRGPWMYTRQRRPYSAPRRGGARSYWA